MNTETEPTAEALPAGKRRTPRWEIALFVVLALVAVFVYALPFAVRYAADDWLRKQGADEVRIEAVRINLFRGQAALIGFYARDGEHPPLEVDKLGVSFSWGSLFDRRAEVTGITLEGARIPVHLDAAGDLRVGIQLPAPSSEPEPEPAPEPAAPWGFALRSVTISDSQVVVDTPQYQGSWTIAQVSLDDLVSWLPDQVARLRLVSELNKAQVIVDAELQPFADARQLDLQVQLQGVQLEDFAVLGGEALQALSGTLNASLRLRLEMQGERLRLRPSGKLQLTDMFVRDAAGRELRTWLNWKGDMDVTVDQSSQQVAVAGELRLAQPRLVDPQSKTELQLGGMTWQGDVRYAGAPGGGRVEVDGSASLEQGVLQLPEIAVLFAQLGWQGTTRVGLSSTGGPQVAIRGPLSLQQLDLAVPDYRVKLGGALWAGDVDLGLGGETLKINARGELEASTLAVTQVLHELLLVSLENLKVQRIAVDGLEQQSLAEVHLAGLKALHAPGNGRPEVLRLGTLRGTGIVRKGSLVTVDAVDLESLDADLQRSADGGMTTLALLGSGPAEAPAPSAAEPAVEEPATTTPAAEPLRVQVERLQLTGPSTVRFADLAVKPRFATELDILKLELGRIDSGDPALQTPFEMALRTRGEGDLKVRGKGRFMADPLDLEARLDARALELVNLSPYAIQTIGYEFDAGQLNLVTVVKIDGGKISGENKIHLVQTALTKVNATVAEKLTRSLTMPLNSALSLLRDSDGDIKLKIPLGGDLQNPEVNVQDAINTVLGKAVRKAALGYLKHTLQPYGGIITLVQVLGEAGEKITALKLEPVTFAAADQGLSPQANDYLEKIAGLLRQRPELQIKLCGVATPADQAALDAAAAAGDAGDAPSPANADGQVPTLRELAEGRARNVKSLLVEKHGISSGQLFLCAPEIREDDDEPPSVNMRV